VLGLDAGDPVENAAAQTREPLAAEIVERYEASLIRDALRVDRRQR
jgi:hypothetical protein